MPFANKPFVYKGKIMDSNTPNPYESSVIANSDVASTGEGGNHDLIDSLDVSDGWKRKFHVIDDMQNIKDPKERKAYFKSLTWGERFGQSNILAFLFSWLYFFIKGMWRAGLTFLGLYIVLIVGLVVFNIDSEAFARAAGLAFGITAMTRANIIYYTKKVLGKDLWI